MIPFVELLTAGGTKWHETLPFLVGGVFVLLEIGSRVCHGQRPYFHVPTLGFVLSEGISLTLMPIYGFALAFYPKFAEEIASKNGKVLAVAMFVAFGTLLIHMCERWFQIRHAD